MVASLSEVASMRSRRRIVAGAQERGAELTNGDRVLKIGNGVKA